MKLKRLAAGITAAVMAFTVVGTPLGDILPEVKANVATVAGAETYTYGDFEYDILDDGTVEITDYSGSAENVDIPAEIDGKSVTRIGWHAFGYCTSLKSIMIPDSVTSIGREAFHGCTSLASITIPNSVTVIGAYAFEGCTNLTSITIPDSVTEIYDYTFKSCESLTNITIPDSVTEIGDYAFIYCRSLSSIMIPDSVTKIGIGAFSDCTSLTAINVASENSNYVSVNGVLYNKDKTTIICYPAGKKDNNYKIPDSVTEIDDYAFNGCTSLTSITIPNSVTEIGYHAFEGCTSLTNMTIPDNVTSIGGDAFKGCTNLTSITIPDSVEFIGVSAFYGCTSLTNMTIPDNVTWIGSSLFYGCTSLTSVTLPDSMTEIGNYTFYDCSNLKSITIPDNVTSIGEYAFYNCTNIANITLPDSVTKIGDAAFCDCTSLKSITIPDVVTSIGWHAFEGCISLKSVTIPDGVTSIGWEVFNGCTSLTSITIPNSVTSIGNSAFNGCTSLTNITIPDSVTDIGDFSGCVFEGCTSLTSITIPNSVTRIGKNTFNNCKSLASVMIPDSVTSIGESAFGDCTSLTSVTIPNSVTEIGGGAFEYCSNLTSITIPDSVTEIGGYAFKDCISLVSVSIPDSVTEISRYAFSGCTSLTSITIPDSVTYIDEGAFYGCTSLTSVTIPDSVTEIGSEAFSGCSKLRNATILNCGDIIIIDNAFEGVADTFYFSGYSNTEVQKFAIDHNIRFESLGGYYYIPPMVSKSSYSLRISDENGNLIKDAVAKLGDQQYNAQDGIINIDNISAVQAFTISANGYADMEIYTDSITSSTLNYITMSKEGESASEPVSNVYCSEFDNIDELYNSGKIWNYMGIRGVNEVIINAKTMELKKTKNTVSDYYDFYLYCAGKADVVKTYKVMCNDKVISSSSTPKLTINTSQLSEDTAIKLICELKNGENKEYKLNLKFTDNSQKNAEMELSGSKATLKYPDELSWLGSASFDLPKVPVYLNYTGDEIRVGIGVERDVLDSDDSFYGFQKSFKKYQSNLKTSKEYLATKSLKELKEKYLADSEKSTLPGIDGKFEITLVGCGGAKFDKKEGATVYVEVILTVDFSASYSQQFFAFSVPLMLKVEAGIEVENTVHLALTGVGTDELKFEGNWDAELTPYVKPYAAIGVDKVANAGVFGEIKLPIKLCLLSTDAKKQGLNSIDLEGKVGLRANLLWLEHDWTMFEGSTNLYTRPGSLMSSTIAQREAVMSCVKYENAVQAAQNIANYSAVSNTTEYTVTDSNEGLIANNVSPLSSSDVLVTDDMTILASVNSDLSRGINNQTYISTAVFKDGKWSEIKAVNDSSLAEFAPKLYMSGDDIFLIYQQALKTFDDSAESSEITKNIGIAVSKFNPETLTFENTNTVYSTAGYSTEPKTYDGYSVWLTNSEGDPFGKSDNNSIIVYDGSSATAFADNISNAVSVDIGKLSGDTYIAYLTDGDGDLSTTDDIRLYAVPKNGGTPVQVDEGAIESFEFAKVGDGKLVWNKEGKLYTIDSENASACDTGICINGDFGILDDGTLYYTGSTSEQSAVYLMKAGENTWENPYEYFTCNGNINKTYSDGQSILIDAADSDDPDCAHRLYLTKSVECKDIIVEAVSFDPGYIVSGSQIPLTLALTNNGSETVQTAAFRITDEEMNTISVYTLDNLDIKPGSTTECTILVKPEDNCLNKKVYVTVIEPTDSSELSDSALDADLEKDRTVENNKYLLDFTKSDLEVKIEEYLFGKNNSLIFTVMNNTDVATGGTLSITDSDGDELLSKHYDDITFNNSQIVELKVSELISKGKAGDVITATVTADNDDYSEYNNTASHSIKLKLDEVIDSFTASDIGKTQLTLNWSGLTKKCGVVVEQLVGNEWEEIAILNDGSVGKYTVSGLTETTRYSFRIRAFENFGSETGYGEYQLLETSTCHNFGEWVTVTESTCTEDGEESRTCEVCGKTETRRTAATGHDYSDEWTVDVEAACNDGSKSHHCTRCDAKTDITVIPGKGHTVVIDAAVAPSCTEPGLTKGSHCSVCDEIIKEQEIIPALGHDIVSGICKNCKQTELQCMQSNHPYDNDCDQTWTIHREGAVRIDVTFTEDTYTESNYDYIYIYDGDDELIGSYSGDELSGKTITVNSDTVKIRLTSDSSNTEYGFALAKIEAIYETQCDHSNTEIRYAKSAGCTTEGYTGDTYCKDCGEKISSGEVIPAKGHTEVTDKAVAATCTKTGLTEGKHCSVCGTAIKAQETVPATGKHSFGNWKITKAATCTATGTKTRTCSVCGKVETATIAKVAHKYVNTVVKPTYTAQGYTLHKCSVCGTSYKDTYTAKLTLAKVTGAKLGGRAADALRINWSKNASADGYIVEMYQGNKWVRVAKITSNSTTTFRKAGLKASSVYKFRVRAYKMEGKAVAYGAYSTELVARTNPSVMTGAKLGGRAADALRINWSKNASADGYIVEMYQGNKWVRVAKITNGNTTTFRKAVLKASTVYKFRVRAYKMSGKTALYGNYSATVTARTNPSIVKGVKIAGKAKDALRVNWTKNASAQGYIVEMYKGGKWVRVAKITNGNTTTFRKAGLAKNTAYKFRVCAYYMSGKTALYGNYGSVSGKTAAK